MFTPAAPHQTDSPHWKSSMLNYSRSYNHNSMNMPTMILTFASATMSNHRLRLNTQYNLTRSAQYKASQHENTVQHQRNRQPPFQIDITANDNNSYSLSHTGTPNDNPKPFSTTNHTNPSNTMSYDLCSQISSCTGGALYRIQTRSYIDRMTCYWSGIPTDFDTNLIKLFWVFAQRGAQYIGNPLISGTISSTIIILTQKNAMMYMDSVRNK